MFEKKNLYCFHVFFPWHPEFKGFFSLQICNLNVLTIHLFSHKLSDFPHTFNDLLHFNIFKDTLEPMNKTVVLYWSGINQVVHCTLSFHNCRSISPSPSQHLCLVWTGCYPMNHCSHHSWVMDGSSSPCIRADWGLRRALTLGNLFLQIIVTVCVCVCVRIGSLQNRSSVTDMI